MSIGGFSLAALRVAAIVVPAWFAAHYLRAWLVRIAGARGCGQTENSAQVLLAETVLTLSAILVAAESLGLLGLDRSGPLIGLLWAAAGLSWLLARPRAADVPAAAHKTAQAKPVGIQGTVPTKPTRPTGSKPIAHERTSVASAAVAVVFVSAQWVLQTANALGSGMLSFDTLWYHMPFAAHFAQTGSVTAIQFTQADPFVAYFPANSELFHAVGLVALHGDFLSPLLNLMWLSLALLAAWCLGRPWRAQALTLTAGCLVMSLPVLSATQPGEAFNDTAGLASLLAAAALALNAPKGRSTLIVAGFALGLSAGTKLTFLVPALCLLVGIVLLAPPGRRGIALVSLGLPLALTGGWWYLRNMIALGNPLGLSVHLGPLKLPGPRSSLADASHQTVASQIGHISLWASRFAPGLDHALGALWPLMLTLCLAAILAGVLLARDPRIRVLALAAAAAGVSYLLLPTGATGIQRGTNQFAVNLRYATPALALGVLLIPLVARVRAPRLLRALGPALVVALVLTQFQQSLWPTQTARHAAFLLACAVAGAATWWMRAAWQRSADRRLRPAARIALVGLGVALAGAGAFAAQRHYYERRYLAGDRANPSLGAIYQWAQNVAHARIALYGTVEQYPLYGSRDTNIVDYLGSATAHGGYRPISSCTTWRRRLSAGGYRYVVLSAAPTRAEPIAWTTLDPDAVLLLHPTADDFVFKLDRRSEPAKCV
jgi:hypothetical protein